MRDSNGQYPGLRRSCRQLFVGFVIITGIAVFGVYWDVAALQHCSSYSAALLGVGMTIMVFQAGRSFWNWCDTVRDVREMERKQKVLDEVSEAIASGRLDDADRLLRELEGGLDA